MNEINDININKIIDNKNILKDIQNISHFLEKDNNKQIYIVEKEDNNSLCFYFANKEKLYNKKGTKLLNKGNFQTLINIFNEYLKTNDEYVFLFFKKINIDIFKVIINGYINFELNEKEKNDVFIFITNILPFYFEKKIFYFVYNKLSKIFRKFHLYKNKKELFDKFTKILEIWKLLYKVENLSKVNQFYIALLGNNSFTIDLSKFMNKKYKMSSINIEIEFAPYFPSENIEKVENFSFFKAIYNSIEPKEIKMSNIRVNELKNLNKIKFQITTGFIIYCINENCEYENGNKNIINGFVLDNKTYIEKIEILNNYIGTIKSIKILAEINKGKIEYEFLINENKEQEEKIYKFINTSEPYDKEIPQINSYPLKENLIDCKMMNEIFYDDIKYYGGFGCFIPILKIIKYFISEFKDDSLKIYNLNQFIIEIMKTILNIIYYNKKNYLNFKDILIPLLGALAEINNVLPKNYQKELYNNSIFSLFYVLIISSSISIAQKKGFIMISGLDSPKKLNINFEDLIINIDKLDPKGFEWYSIILYIYIQFTLLVFNDYTKIKNNIFQQLINLFHIGIKKFDEEMSEINSLIKFLIGSLIYICDMNDIKNFEKINNINNFIKDNSDIFVINQNYYLKNIIIIMILFFNLIDFDVLFGKKEKYEDNIINKSELQNKLRSNIKDNYNDNKYENKFIEFFGSLEELFQRPDYKDNKEKLEYLKLFKISSGHKIYIQKIFNEKDSQNFELESEIIIQELTDYHGQYHKLMKNLFLFNNLWSDKKLYYNEIKKDLLKYKCVNYYTTNFLKPFLIPINDYKYSYPTLSDFEIKKGFYLIEENEDDYNFYLDCPEFDKFCQEYEKEILKKMENECQMDINSYDVCLVKRTHHVKGKLYVLNKDGLIQKFIFYSFPFDIVKNIPCCNVIQNMDHINHKKEKLCFGETLICPKKDMNRKKIIKISNVRLILNRIYFYRKTAIEIFTNTKSYYFNFAEDVNKKESKKGEESCLNIIKQMAYYYKTIFFPINIGNKLIGFSRDFGQILKKYSENKKYEYLKKKINLYQCYLTIINLVKNIQNTLL